MTKTWLEQSDEHMRDAIDYGGRAGGYSPPGVSDDLNLAHPFIDWGTWDKSRTRTAQHGKITTHFGDLTDEIVAFIEGSECVAVCVAWLTAQPILEALAKVQSVVVVQKEDFLRPDSGRSSNWKRKLRESYGSLHNDFARQFFPEPLGRMDQFRESDIDPISCVGNHNEDRSAAMPRMHHKFLVRFKENFELIDQDVSPYVAESVWTGSFNFSANAGRSFENAVEIHDPSIADEYFKEFCRVASLSEPLNWQHRWATPRYRLGT